LVRDDFTRSVKETLAKRVALRCSKRDCRVLTAFPHSETDKAGNIGVAAHITAASAGGPRYDPSLTAQQRKSAENGIWLCPSHGTLVDADERRFPVDLLRQWKAEAEQETLREVTGQAAADETWVPSDGEVATLIRSRRRCCLCFHLDGDDSEKAGQLVHLDHDSTDRQEDNLAWLCSPHRARYDSKRGQSKGLTLAEVRHSRNTLYEIVEGPTADSLASEPISLPPFRFAQTWSTSGNSRLVDSLAGSAHVEFIADIFGDPVELARNYIEPNCQHFNPADDKDEEARFLIRNPAFKCVEDFLSGQRKPDGRNQLFILSDAGMGKSSLLVMLKLTHLASLWPDGYECTLLKLGPTTLEDLTTVAGRRNKVLLLDALDEDPLAWGQVANRVADILTATRNFRAVIISCRTQFFAAGEDPFNLRGQVEVAGFLCPVLYLSLFDERQVDDYLLTRLPNDGARRAKAKAILVTAGSLRFRPMLLAHVEDLVDSDNEIWTEFTTYEALLKAWLLREQRKHLPGINQPPMASELWLACQKLAVLLHTNEERTISPKALDSLAAEDSGFAKIAQMNLKGRSFINTDSKGNFRFSHLSILEFLLAHGLAHRTLDSASGSLRTTDKILTLLASWIHEDLSRSHSVDLSPLQFVKARLSHLDLSHFTLCGLDFQDAVFRKANLRGAFFRDANLHRVDFTDANLSGADLRHANLKAATVSATEVSGAYFEGASIREVRLAGLSWRNLETVSLDLRGANLRGMDLRVCPIHGKDLSFADLQELDLRDIDLRKSNLRGANLYKANLTAHSFDGSCLHAANLEGAIVKSCSFRKADLSWSNLQAVDLRGLDLCEADLSGSYMLYGRLAEAAASKANLTAVQLERADLSRTDLRGACMREAELPDANLRGANLEGADLRDANLLMADLRDACLRNADLRNAVLCWATLDGADLSGVRIVGHEFGSAGMPF
jgi:uncharacterized protein YjbI with pentapeptide repeats